MMAAIEHPDMPKSIGGIQGMNLWNVLIANVVFGWLINRPAVVLVSDAPGWLKLGLAAYVCMLTVSYVRLALDPSNLDDYSFLSGFSEYWVNSIKFLVPGVLLFDGARDPRRMQMALASVLGIYFLLAVQVIRWMPLSYIASGDDLSARASKLLENEIGYNRVTLSMLLAGASWAIVAALPLVQRNLSKLAILGAAAIVVFGQALTGGRTGYLCWGVVGLSPCVARWRKLLPLLPLGALSVILLVPAVKDRILMGMGTTEGNVVIAGDTGEMTSGRTKIWPHVIDQIGESPLIGHGRLAMRRTGLTEWLIAQMNENFAHPHNAYLEQLLDNGLIGLLIVAPLLLAILYHAFRDFVQRESALHAAIGGAAVAMLLALLIGAFGGQTFYPREGYVGMWALIGLAMRAAVERSQGRTDTSVARYEETGLEDLPPSPAHARFGHGNR
jgi:O-antigen ligase